MASTSQGLPNTWVAKMAEVFSVMAASILAGSIFKDCLSISTNTGVQPSQTMLLVVATNENGVVMISPFSSKALIVICKATVPLVTKSRCFTLRCSLSFISSSLAKGPILVSHCLFQMPVRYFSYSSWGGRKGLVTGIIF